MNNLLPLRYKAAALLTGIAAFAFSASAGEKAEDSAETKDTKKVRESIFNYNSPTLSDSHFTWGAEFGASIDLSGYDMSTFDLDVVLGYKNSIIKTLGISAGVHRDFHQGTTFVPLEAVIRTSFVPQQSLVFLNLKAGYSFNTVGDAPTSGGFIFNSGVGFNLYTSKRVQTHLLLSYQFIHLNEQQGQMIDKRKSHTDMVQIGFGVNF